MKTIRSLLALSLFECRRICRNRVVLVFLLLFATLMAFAFNSVTSDVHFSFAVENKLDRSAESVLEEMFPNHLRLENVVYVSNAEEGLALLEEGRVNFYLCLYEEEGQVRGEVHYYEYSYSDKNAISGMKTVINRHAFDTVIERLSEYGITLKTSHFEPITFIPRDQAQVLGAQPTLAMQLAIFIPAVILFGLAFSVSRDNESGVSRQLAYTPIGVQTYLISKALPHFVWGLCQVGAVLLIGHLGYGFSFSVPFGYVFLTAALIVPPMTAIGLLICRLKSQIAVVLCSFGILIFPVISSMLQLTSVYPLPLLALLYLSPVTPFYTLFESLAYRGTPDLLCLVLMLLQTVVYYALSVVVLKKETGK